MTRQVKVLVASSSRADIGIVGPVWDAIHASPQLGLDVLLTGMHVPDDRAARRRVPEGVAPVTLGRDLGGEQGQEAALAMAGIAEATATLLAQLQPDVVLVSGDRLDMIPVAYAATPFNIPIAHIAGGDLTLGAIDDRIRHAMTKLSHLHFTVTAEAADRVARMGEEPWRIHVAGAPNLDTLARVPQLTLEEFVEETGLTSSDGIRLVTVHPETNSTDPGEVAVAVLEALDRHPGPTLLTAPNDDPGGTQVRRLVEEFVSRREWAVFRDTLGARLYANALRYASVMVGNSSSGIVEAEMFGLPVLDVGRRQEGRARGRNVRHSTSEAGVVATALQGVLAEGRFSAGSSLYGDGHAAERIVGVLEALPDNAQLLHKGFFEGQASFTAPWSAVGSGS